MSKRKGPVRIDRLLPFDAVQIVHWKLLSMTRPPDKRDIFIGIIVCMLLPQVVPLHVLMNFGVTVSAGWEKQPGTNCGSVIPHVDCLVPAI